MYKKTLRDRIISYLLAWKSQDKNKWFHKGELESLAKQNGYLGDNCARELRRLVEDGIIINRKVGKSQEYQYNF